MNIVRQLGEDSWREFVNNHPGSQAFHTPEMSQVFGCAKGHHPILWAAVDNQEQVLALLLPVQVTSLSELSRWFTTRSVVYGSVLCVPGAKGCEALANLLHTYKREVNGFSLFTELRNVTDTSALQPILAAEGFTYEGHLNYLIDLNRSPEALLQSFNSSTRKLVRRWLNRGDVVIEEVSERSQIGICYDLMRRTYERVRVPLPDVSLFYAAFDILHQRGMIKGFIARVGDAYASCVLQLIHKDIIYGWYGGMDRTYASSAPNEILFWHVLKWGAENGFRVFDFGGGGKPGEDYGPAKFKAKFGGRLVEFGRNTYVHSNLRFRISQVGYRLYRRLL